MAFEEEILTLVFEEVMFVYLSPVDFSERWWW
jgi:hypothetical protein